MGIPEHCDCEANYWYSYETKTACIHPPGKKSPVFPHKPFGFILAAVLWSNLWSDLATDLELVSPLEISRQTLHNQIYSCIEHSELSNAPFKAQNGGEIMPKQGVTCRGPGVEE